MKEYALIGRKLGHSFSADYFNSKFKKEGIDAQYYLWELPEISLLPELISAHPLLEGLNVTIPYKEEIIPYLDSLSPLAEQTGAVNCVKVIRSEESSKGYFLQGHNTDVEGFMSSVRPLLQSDSKKALILGTGGASKAVKVGLEKLGLEILFVSRNPGEWKVSYRDLTPEQVWEADLIVNTTPLGMYPNLNAVPPFPFQYMRSGKEPNKSPQVAFDLIYNPSETLFMKICAAHGALVSNGLAMLHSQAEGAWRFWNAD